MRSVRGIRGKTDWSAIVKNSPDSALVQILGSVTFGDEAVYAAMAELTRRSELAPRTNLSQWRKELVVGTRDIFTFDDLWRLACEEASSVETPPRTRPRWSDLKEEQ